MSGLETYRIERSKKFESSLKKLIRTHYKRREKDRVRFLEQLSESLDKVEIDPLKHSDPEPFPKGYVQEGLELRKYRWQKLPGLSGSSRFDRLIFTMSWARRMS